MKSVSVQDGFPRAFLQRISAFGLRKESHVLLENMFFKGKPPRMSLQKSIFFLGTRCFFGMGTAAFLAKKDDFFQKIPFSQRKHSVRQLPCFLKNTIVYWGYIGIMEMETTIVYWDILGLYWERIEPLHVAILNLLAEAMSLVSAKVDDIQRQAVQGS